MAKRASKGKSSRSAGSDRYKALLDKVQQMDLGGGTFWKPPEGRTTVRILPPVGDMEFFFREVGRHYIGGSSYYCPRLSTDGQQRCPLCDLNQMLYEAGEKDAASQWRASRSFYMNIVVRGEESAGPRMFTPGITVFSSVVALAQDPDYGEVYDEYDGTDLSIDREGSGLDTKYNVLPKRDTSPLSDDDDEIDEWLETAVDIDEYIDGQLLDYDELAEQSGAAVFLQEGTAYTDKPEATGGYEEGEELWDEDDEPEDESPSAAVKRRLVERRKKQRRPARTRR